MLAMGKIGAAVLQHRNVVDEGAPDIGGCIRPVFGPPRHPRVSRVQCQPARPALVRDELGRVVPHPAEVALGHGDAAEGGVRSGQFEARERRVREARRALEPGDSEEPVRQQRVADRPAAAQREVALPLEIGGGFVEAAPVALDVAAAASDVSRFQRHLPREFPLDADGELVHVRRDEVRVEERQPASEERQRSE